MTNARVVPHAHSLVRASALAFHRFLQDSPTPKAFVAIFVGAWTVRVLFALAWILFTDFRFNGAELGKIAVHLANGRGFSSPFSELGHEPTAFYAPLVPAIWAVIMQFTGGVTRETAWVITLVQTVPSALCASVYWLVARKIAARMTPALPGLASVVAFVAALWPESIVWVVDTWYYDWQELGVAVLALAAMRWVDAPDLRRAAQMAAAIGVVALINPTPVPLFAMFLLVPLFQSRRQSDVLRNAAVSAVLAILIVSPWLLRNALVFGEFVPLRSTTGLELRQGNSASGSVRQNAKSAHPTIQAEERKRFTDMGEIAYGRFAQQEAIAYMRAHPGVTAKRFVQRFYVTWFSDLFDHWSWQGGESRWRGPGRFVPRAVITIVCSLLPLAILLYGLATNRLRHIPYTFVFVAVLGLLPLANYVIIANPPFSRTLRPWLLMLCVIAILRAVRDARANRLRHGAHGSSEAGDSLVHSAHLRSVEAQSEPSERTL